MATNPNDALNGSGGKYFIRSGAARRAHRAEVAFKGHALLVDFFADGAFLPATDDMPAESPTVTVKSVELVTYGRAASGEFVRCLVNVTELFSEWSDDISELIERSWSV